MDPPLQADDHPPRRPVRLRLPWRWSRASSASNARPDARPRLGAHRRWRAVRSRQHPRAVSIEELGQRSTPRERKNGPPGVPTRGSCAPGRPRLPIVCTRPSFARNIRARRGPGSPSGATGRRSGAVTMAVANHATERGRAPGWRPGPVVRVVAGGLSGVALGGSLRNGSLAPARDPRPDRLGRRDGLRLGRRRLGGRPALGGLRARAALRSALVYSFQWDLPDKPAPSRSSCSPDPLHTPAFGSRTSDV